MGDGTYCSQTPLGVFLKDTAHHPELNSLKFQLATQMSLKLEQLFGRSSKDEQGTLSEHVSIRWLSMPEVKDSNIDASLAGCQLACVEAAHGHSSW